MVKFWWQSFLQKFGHSYRLRDVIEEYEKLWWPPARWRILRNEKHEIQVAVSRMHHLTNTYANIGQSLDLSKR